MATMSERVRGLLSSCRECGAEPGANIDCEMCVYSAQIFEEIDAPRQREQRRYEIARDCMASAYNNPALFTDMAARVAHAVKAADALLAELERTDGD